MKIEEEIEAIKFETKRIKKLIRKEFIKKGNGVAYMRNFESRKYVESLIDEKVRNFKYAIKERNQEICGALQYWETLFT